MTRFRTLFAADLLILVFALWQCAALETSPLVSHVPDGSRSPIPQAAGDAVRMVSPLIALILATLAVLGGATLLHRRGRTGLATLLLLLPALPAILGGLLVIGLMILFFFGMPSS